MPVWLIEKRLRPDGEWRLEQPYHLYKRKETGLMAVRRLNAEGYRHEYRLAEYRQFEG